MSWMSKVVQFLIKVCFVPVTYDHMEDRYIFSLCSVKTLVFFLIYWGLLLSTYISGTVGAATFNDALIEYAENTNIIDSASSFFFGIFTLGIFAFSPLFLAKGVPFISAIVQASDLRWPRHGAKHILSYIMCAFGLLVVHISVWSMIMKFQDGSKNIFVLPYVAIALNQLLGSLYWMVPLLLLSTWMEKFILLCNLKILGKEIQHTRKCMEMYRSFQSGFGTFFCFLFGVTQLLLIISLFMAITRALGSIETLPVKLAISLGFVSVSCGLFLNIAALTLIMDTAYAALRSLIKSLHDFPSSEGAEKKMIKNLIKELEEMKPLGGNGYFAITKGTLIGMGSVGITYVIILVQFKISAS